MFSGKTYILEGSYINRAFQLSVELKVANTIYGTVKYNSIVIYNWAKEKFPSLQLPYSIRSYSRNRSGQEVNVIFNSNEPYFCMKAIHPDRNIAGRIWTTEVEIVGVDSKVMMAVKLSYATPRDSTADDVGFSVPAFVRKIYKHNGIIDVRCLQTVPWDINSEIELESLYDLIHDEKRMLPVVVITESPIQEGVGGQYLSGYLIDAEVLAQKAGLIAHIIRIPNNLASKWGELSGKNWSVYGGAIRTYFPGANFGEDDYMRHPLSIISRIMASNYIDKTGTEYVSGEAFENILYDSLTKYNISKRIDWKELGYKFYFNANRELMRQKEETSSDFEQLRKMYEEQIKQLEERIDNQQDEIITALVETENKEKELDDSRATIYHLNARVDMLEKQVASTKEETTSIPIWNDYTKLQKWIETYLPGKVVLHSRAVRALKEATYEDAELVFKSLHLLGTTYYQMRMGNASREEFDRKCVELGIEETGSIADTAAGELGETYFINYYGKRKKLDRHLRKGTSRDPRYCMRIYFFWSEEESQVVVGYLPQHLMIRIS